MIAVSGGLIFLGYQLLVYGWSQVQGSNAGFFDILWPGRYQGPYPDPPNTPSGTTTTKSSGLPTAPTTGKNPTSGLPSVPTG